MLKFCTFNYFVNIMRVSKWMKGKCVIVGDRVVVYGGKFVRGVNCSDWTCGYCSGHVSKERYNYVIDKIFEGVD